MVSRMSCVHQDVSCDRFEVAGILMNDGRGCGGHERIFSREWVVRKLGHEWMWSCSIYYPGS